MAAARKDDRLDEQRHADRAFERLVSLRLVAFEARRRTEEEYGRASGQALSGGSGWLRHH
eukprot:CAMPEP_0118809694 /NCGR_PEP_ID=MMETSP1162-20130426/474_1 /TAXON_ID=33656 /ORGANISM="Phaeocystis Sp, Strain CCMP2710" /LENGTH=59 /DNA_ID=CAMNT_0006739155 /DNA_START=740 /DNA_END=919 /DNA_ORIENTATION=-